MDKKFAEIGDASGNKDVVFDITPDLADAFTAAIRNAVGVEYPRHARTFDDLTATIAQTSRVIQHLEAFRELAIVTADKTSPHADRKAIAIAAGFPPSRLYRLLEKHGRPKDRRAEVLPDLGRLEQHLANIRAQAANADLTSEQREKLEQAIPKIEAQIAEVRAQTTADRATEK
jgi:hypothetical protein